MHKSCLPKAVCHGPTGISREELVTLIRQLIAALEHRDPNAAEIRIARSLLEKA